MSRVCEKPSGLSSTRNASRFQSVSRDIAARDVMSLPRLQDAIHVLLHDAALNLTFTSLYSPTWNGWATSLMVASHLGKSADVPWEGPETDERDVPAYQFVPLAMETMVVQGRLEKRTFHPLKHSLHPQARNIIDIEYRLPECVGYSRYYYGRPIGDGDVDDDEAMDQARAITSRQIRQITRELRDMGCQVPPFLLRQFERSMNNKSGCRAFR